MTVYKLTDENMKTRGGCQWEIGVKKTTDGSGDLCGPGWLHCYIDPTLAVLMNPAHAGFTAPRLFKAEAGGSCKAPNQSKSGYTEMMLIEEMALPEVTIEQRITFALLCAKQVYKGAAWNKWADKWLSGEDRSASASAAAAAAAASYASIAAAGSAANAAAYAANANAAYTARAAAYANSYANARAAANAASYAAAYGVDLIALAKLAMAEDLPGENHATE